jgi:hypothetical protein
MWPAVPLHYLSMDQEKREEEEAEGTEGGDD